MNRIIRSELSIIAVLLVVPMAFVGCTDPMLWQTMCAAICLPFAMLNGYFWIACIGHCNGYRPVSLQGCIDNPDDCAAMFELYEAAMQTCEAYPEECAEVLDSYAQSFDTDGEE